MFFVLFWFAGCGFFGGSGGEFFTQTEVGIVRHHLQQYRDFLRNFTVRLYAKNPKYEKDQAQQRRKIDSIFGPLATGEQVSAYKPSHEILTAAFQGEVSESGRAYLLSLGLWKSIREAYNIRDGDLFLSGLQVSLERLQRFHHNISQVNWRLKTCKDKGGKLYSPDSFSFSSRSFCSSDNSFGTATKIFTSRSPRVPPWLSGNPCLRRRSFAWG
ncbi:MAG: hypothetical protein WCV64_08830 [Desulfurivibrionaceae bacterium]